MSNYHRSTYHCATCGETDKKAFYSGVFGRCKRCHQEYMRLRRPLASKTHRLVIAYVFMRIEAGYPAPTALEVAIVLRKPLTTIKRHLEPIYKVVRSSHSTMERGP